MKIIALWGSPGAGKTALTLAVAAELAKRKADVLVLGADNGVPSLPVYLPLAMLPMSASIGGALEGVSVTEGELKGRLHKHPKSDRIYFAGYVSGEMPVVSHKVPQRGTIETLFQVLQGSPYRYCLVDCATSPVLEPLTLYALEAAQAVVRVVTPDVKGWEWQQSQVGWLSNNDAFGVDRHVKVCNMVLPTTPCPEVQALFGNFDAMLPFAAPVAERMTAGELLADFHDPAGLNFARKVAGLAERIQEEVKEHAD